MIKAAKASRPTKQDVHRKSWRRNAAAANDDVLAVGLYFEAANAGNAEGMLWLGVFFDKGRGGLPKDDAQATSWYRKAAEAGNVVSMNNLGVALAAGLGVRKDAAQAASWYRKAAEAGSAVAMNNLGNLLEEGDRGLPKDSAQAVSWLRKAADAGHPEAMNWVGFVLAGGRNSLLPRNETQAVDWFRKAADAGSARGMYNLAACSRKGAVVCPKIMLKLSAGSVRPTPPVTHSLKRSLMNSHENEPFCR